MEEILLDVKDLKKHYPIKSGIFKKTVGSIKAVDGVSFNIERGRTFGLVGESGCGKTTAGKSILRLIEPTGGEVDFNGTNVLELDRQKLRALRKEFQIIFQDPYGSLNPRMTVHEIIKEPMVIHDEYRGREREKRVRELMEIVGLAGAYINRYPHEFSGGQRQRIGIARALALNPKLIICDEPVSALDVSIQSQILNLLMDLQREYNLAYLFIAHGLSVVRHISHTVGVMYLGKIVEIGEKNEIFDNPLHPYTKALMSAIPVPDPKVKKTRIILAGDVPSPANPPSGCRFHTRCVDRLSICCEEEPKLKESGKRQIACHLFS